MTSEIRGPWSRPEIDDFLQRAGFPLRLACVAEDGFPRVVSLWYGYQGGRLLCVTHRDSALARLLRRNNRVGFEVAPNEPPYHGVRGQGEAVLEPLGGRDTLQQLLQRYLGGTDSSLAEWLLGRSAEEVLMWPLGGLAVVSAPNVWRSRRPSIACLDSIFRRVPIRCTGWP